MDAQAPIAFDVEVLFTSAQHECVPECDVTDHDDWSDAVESDVKVDGVLELFYSQHPQQPLLHHVTL